MSTNEIALLQKGIRDLREKYQVCLEMMKGCQQPREFAAYREGLDEISNDIFEAEQELLRLINEETEK
jgi:predicted  nucleic acid-binding Zn-ribbon protein